MQFKRVLFGITTGIGFSSLMLLGCAPPETTETEVQSPNPTAQTSTPATTAPTQATPADVPYVPTPTSVVDEMLRVAKVSASDRLYDLGSGDGRIVITAAQQYGAQGVGVDVNPELIQQARENANQAGVENRVEFRQQDLFQTDLSQATVVTLYLLPEVNLRLRPKLLRELQPGTRVVSHAFDMGDWEPQQTVQVDGRTIYYWVVPETVPENLLSEQPQ